MSQIKLFFKFKAMAAQGNLERGIALLDKLDAYFGEGKE